MAAAPQTYAEFKKLHPGVKNETLLRASWDRLVSARQKATTTAPAPPGVPSAPYVPGALDDVGQADLGALRQSRDTALADADLAYGQTEANLNKQVPLIEQQRKLNLQTNDQNAAARGVLRSGIRVNDAGKIETDALRATTDIQDQIRQAAERRDAAKRAAESGYTSGEGQIRAAGGARALQDRLSTYQPSSSEIAGATVPGGLRPTEPAAPAKKAPGMTYARFVQLHGGKGTPALKSAWSKRFGV